MTRETHEVFGSSCTQASALDITTKRRLRNISPSIEQNPETQGPRKTWERLSNLFQCLWGKTSHLHFFFNLFISFTLFLHSTDHLFFPQPSLPSSYFIIPSRSKKQKASGSWHPLLETAKKGKALAQRISNSLLQPVLPYITVILHLEVGAQGETLPSPFDSQREREQKRGRLDMSQADSETGS